MAILVSGYSVVSLPEFNYEEDTEVELFRKAPQVNGVYYAGYQRNEFGEMDKLYRNNMLPDDIKKMYSRVRENQSKGLYDYYVTEIYDDAMSMRNYLNSLGGKFEAIALYSKNIEKYLGSWWFDGSVSFLGHDINADGYSVVPSACPPHLRHLKSATFSPIFPQSPVTPITILPITPQDPSLHTGDRISIFAKCLCRTWISPDRAFCP